MAAAEESSQHAREKWQLLQSLRSTVEGLLTNGVSNVWSVYGGLSRLHAVVERIFKHGCRIFDSGVSTDGFGSFYFVCVTSLIDVCEF